MTAQGPPCRHCPVGSPACVGVAYGAGTVCEAVDPRHPRYQPGMAAVLRVERAAIDPLSVAADARPSVAAHWLALSCDHRGPVCQRGCAGYLRVCLAGRGAVSHADCIRCVAEPGSPGGPVVV